MLDFSKQTSTYAQSQARTHSYDEGLRNYMQGVFNNMFIALVISGLVSFFVSQSAQLMQLFFATPLKWVVLFAPLAFIMFAGYQINRITASQAKFFLWTFSALMGLGLAPIFLLYTNASIARAFFVTASLFGAMSLYGYTTKKDLTAMGSFLIMGLFGIIIASVVNLFLGSSGMSFAISALSVIIFTGLTAYDIQAIKAIYFQVGGNSEATSKAATMGAMSLYINFVNIFISLLQLFGNRR